MFQMSFKSYPIDHWLLPLFHLGLTLNTLWGHPPAPALGQGAGRELDVTGLQRSPLGSPFQPGNPEQPGAGGTRAGGPQGV